MTYTGYGPTTTPPWLLVGTCPECKTENTPLVHTGNINPEPICRFCFDPVALAYIRGARGDE